MAGTVVLREVEDADLPIFYQNQRDPGASWMADVPGRESDQFYEHWEKIRADPSNVLRTILADNVVAGNVVSFLRGGHREVGYWLGREHWGQGVASAALGLFLAELPERPLHAAVSSDNAGSLRVLAKHGFQRVGSETEHSAVRGQANELVTLVLE